MNSLVVDTAIGVVFVFATFAMFISLITEVVSRFIGLRGEYLMRGIRSLVDNENKFELRYRDIFPVLKKLLEKKDKTDSQSSPDVSPVPTSTETPLGNVDPAKGTPEPVSTEVSPTASKSRDPGTATDGTQVAANAQRLAFNAILGRAYIGSSGNKGNMPPRAGVAKLSNADRRNLPSYLSARSFASAVIDLTVPNKDGRTTMDDVRTAIGTLEEGKLRDYLNSLTKTVGGDINQFRTGIEQWYDDHMDRVTGWYKRHVRWITLVFGLAVVLLFNVNGLQITRSLYTDQALRESVVSEATSASDCTTKDAATCLQTIRSQISSARAAGLPIGWAYVTACQTPKASCSWVDRWGLGDPNGKNNWDDFVFFLVVVLGWAVMMLALLPGARFWFDLLGKLGSLRSSGPKPAAGR